MSVVECLAELGGTGARAQLVAMTSRAAVDRALLSGDIVADARGRYALPVADEARRAANRLSGRISHLSAALEHGWEVKFAPARPHVTVPKNRKAIAAQSRGVHVHRTHLSPEEIDGTVTTDQSRRRPLRCWRGVRRGQARWPSSGSSDTRTGRRPIPSSQCCGRSHSASKDWTWNLRSPSAVTRCWASRISSTDTSASCSRRTRSSGTAARQPSNATRGATTRSW
ncbi:hypothetical protein NOCA2170068 [metagenome]|uniref:Uncharacterized protein n=1 Tax=metagenome TaxID=256318 RepID=A0A2P2BXM7_9ZZZZ